MYRILYIIIISLALNDKLPNDVRWVKESNEYKAICHQVYSNALGEINNKLHYNRSSLNIPNHNFAVVMDLDETVLDNSDYQVDILSKNQTFSIESWSLWVKEEKASLVPGAFNYITFLRDNNIQIIFISNRMNERLESTKNNMRKLGIYADEDIYLLRKNKQDKKTVRRNEIDKLTGRMSTYDSFTIIQYLGDAMGDFEYNESDRFGADQFIFPNPMYGKW
jgi:5'-nucleotidase (lipoprotein e(P4) family)